MSVQEIWDETLKMLESAINRPAFEMLLKRIEPVSLDNGKLSIRVMGTFANEYIKEFQELIEKTITNVANEPLVVCFDFVELPEQDESYVFIPPIPQPAPEIHSAQPLKSKSTLNDMYSFDTFVVGESNQFCYNTSRAVAEKPGTIANPLFIYGDVGLGKTHLLHAIGNYVIATRPDLKVVHRHTAAFVNELMIHIRDGRIVDFRNNHLQADLLLLDDIQNLKAKTGTQTEFFQLFNAFYENKKQIVVTSDRPPKELEEIEERVVSRLGWGVIADIQPPNYETRLAILNRKLISDNPGDTIFPEEVLEYIASKISTNIRDLEGVLMSILARAKYNNQKVTIDLAESIINNIAPMKNPREITPLMVIREVCGYFNAEESEVLGKRRKKEIVLPRMVAMYIIREITNMPLVSIGEVFNKDHTSVLYSCEKIDSEMRKDAGLKKSVNLLKDKVLG